MEKLINKLYGFGIIPVVKIEDASKAIKLAQSFKHKGLAVLEITFRTEAAAQAIQNIALMDPDFCVGAGTVLTLEQLELAINVGAKFIVTPGFNPKIVDEALRRNIPIIPGVSSASEIEAALEKDITVMKFFPAEAMGGLNTIKALSGPYPYVRFIPTGGISQENMIAYLRDERIIAVGASWMSDPKDLMEDRFDVIEEKIENTMNSALELDFDHIGLLSNDYDQDIRNLKSMFKQAISTHSKSTFVGQVELVKVKNPLINDVHLAYKTSNIIRSVRYFESLGYQFLEETKVLDDQGKLKAIYFENSVANASIHLIQR